MQMHFRVLTFSQYANSILHGFFTHLPVFWLFHFEETFMQAARPSVLNLLTQYSSQFLIPFRVLPMVLHNKQFLPHRGCNSRGL